MFKAFQKHFSLIKNKSCSKDESQITRGRDENLMLSLKTCCMETRNVWANKEKVGSVIKANYKIKSAGLSKKKLEKSFWYSDKKDPQVSIVRMVVWCTHIQTKKY